MAQNTNWCFPRVFPVLQNLPGLLEFCQLGVCEAFGCHLIRLTFFQGGILSMKGKGKFEMFGVV